MLSEQHRLNEYSEKNQTLAQIDPCICFFWLSWFQPTDDYRPITAPPNESVLGWWCTGYRGSDNAATLVAMVKAHNETEAKAAITQDWPEALEWRFCNESNGNKPGDRFPLQDWMTQRFR